MEKCLRASLFVWVFLVACRGYNMVLARPQWGSKGTRLLCRFTAGPPSAPGMRRKIFAVTAWRYFAWPSFCLEWTPLCRHLSARKEYRSQVFLAFDAVGSLLWSGFYTELGYVFSQ